MTKREEINQVRALINAVNLDTRISNRFIYNKLQDVSKLFIKRDVENNRRIFRSTKLFKTLSCVTLSPAPLESCTNLVIPGCKTVMKSDKKIPKTFLNIMSVFNIDRSVEFISTTPSLFVSINKREFKGKTKYYWIVDDYLYIPDSYISEVIIDGIFENNYDAEKFNNNSCINFLDVETSTPDYLRMDVIRVVASEIAQMTKRIPVDESPELNSNKLN